MKGACPVATENNEESRLRTVTLRNAQSILAARARAEEAARQQTDWLRVTLASIGDGVITADRDGCVTSINAAAEALTGWPQTEALGHLLTEIFRVSRQHTQASLDDPAARALQTGAIIRLASDAVLLDRTGHGHPVDGSAAPIQGESGTRVGTVLVFRDMSQRMRTDLARAHLAAIVESSDDAIVSKTLQSIILSWNKGAERLFGYSAEEAIGRPITMLIPPERREEEQLILERIVRGERIEHFETVRASKTDRRLDISLTISPIRDDTGEVIGASKVARDISERRRLEASNRSLRDRERLARHEAERQTRLLYSLFMQAPTLIAVLRGPDYVVELANPPICEVLGSHGG